MTNALIIFVRHPEPGKVKTRIAAVAGADTALAVYKKLLQHTFEITKELQCDKYVFYADDVAENDLWSKGRYHKLLQDKTDLGDRMKKAFSLLFEKGYKRVCIIGSDCYELTAETIQQAFELLTGYEVVLGPAKDGGYYLLAMKDDVKHIFEGIDWSTEKVLVQTLQKIQQHHYRSTLLPVLNDIDTVEDVPEEWLKS